MLRYSTIKRWLVGSILFVGLLFSQGIGWAENPWKIQINIPEFRLFLFQGAEVYRSYPVAIGKPESPSPIGEYKIINKVVNPTWYPPDHGKPVPAGPHNPLGKFWLGLSILGYGIHGNTAPQSIGSSASLGCFRMRNQDVADLFQFVPVGTPVHIVYDTARADLADERLFLAVFPDVYNLGDAEEAVYTAIQNSGWPYQPHLAALQMLLTAPKPQGFEVPRQIDVASDLPGLDGFLWNQEPYINRGIVADLPASIESTEGNETPPFPGYMPVNRLRAVSEELLNIDWDESVNLLKIEKRKPQLINSVVTKR